MSAEKQKPKRFYKEVSVRADGERYVVLLDGRQAKTQSLKSLTAPGHSLADLIAAEWRVQGEFIDRETMPITSIISAAIDGGEGAVEEWSSELYAYLNSDLLCYRAETPEALVALQNQKWDPFLEWLHQEFRIQLSVTSGIVAVEQPKDATTKLEAALYGLGPEMLFALKRATTLTGSVVLALALWKNAFKPDQIFDASRLDERFQEERWGTDSEAKAREEHLHSEFYALGQALKHM